MKRIIALLLIPSLAWCGCKKDPASPPPPPKASPASTIIDGVTGRSAVQAGQRARQAIDRVKTEERQDLKEALAP